MAVHSSVIVYLPTYHYSLCRLDYSHGSARLPLWPISSAHSLFGGVVYSIPRYPSPIGHPALLIPIITSNHQPSCFLPACCFSHWSITCATLAQLSRIHPSNRPASSPTRPTQKDRSNLLHNKQAKGKGAQRIVR